MNLDLDDLGLGEAVPSKRVPRATRFQPKLVPKPEPVSEPIVSCKQEVDEIEIDVKPSINKPIVIDEAKADEIMALVEEEVKLEEESKAEPMDEDEEDQVIREIDVFLTPSFDNNSQLYVMQYPLRPSWRPYELDERCKEVRIKPISGKVEVDIHLEKGSNYNKDAAAKLKISKQTLSSWKPPLTTSYAVGVLMGNKLHLNPIHAVVQLRPSMKHLISGELINGGTENLESTKIFEEVTEVKATSSSKKQIQGKMETSSTEPVTDAEESWISLAYHGMDSSERSLSTRYRQRMTCQEPSKIQFSMSPDKYANSLCPESSTAIGRDRSLSRRFLLSLPLEERFKKWLSEGSQLNSYNYLKHLAPDDSNEDVLELLLRHALLVQGLWVARTSVFKTQLTGHEPLARDYMLLLFKKDIVITHKQLDEYRHPEGFNQALQKCLNLFAVHRPSFNDWKLKKPKDESFIRSYPDIERKQEKDWEILENKVMMVLQKRRVTRNPSSSAINSLHSSSGNSDQGAKTCVNGPPGSSTMNMSDETREALPKALEVILRKHNVCSLELILEGLKEHALSKSAGRGEEVVARETLNAPEPEVQSIIDQLAVNIHGVYVLKSLGDPTLDPFRSAVITLFCGKEPNAKVKKAEIAAAAKLRLNRDMNPKEYSQVVNQLCVPVKGNAWVLKDGLLK
ncbi:Dna-directed rna polymerase iii subunit rpc5 [Thalictrum thalictroides]|uniref:Dna-directed rna polymerase iii subunit rpc5 n=1 Tax=Thalictrum thalictroides TaxID=46969 RepID=A0A7J6XA85_THATH|nr:Dna-directed rna polymerase iii subunit rpc5 [Thalictrum thalictroides]